MKESMRNAGSTIEIKYGRRNIKWGIADVSRDKGAE